jgi:hypothetical protein
VKVIKYFKNLAIPGPGFADIVEMGFLDSNSASTEHAIEAAKLLTSSNLVVSSLTAQPALEKVLKTPGNDYKEVLSSGIFQYEKTPKGSEIANVLDAVRDENKTTSRASLSIQPQYGLTM